MFINETDMKAEHCVLHFALLSLKAHHVTAMS